MCHVYVCMCKDMVSSEIMSKDVMSKDLMSADVTIKGFMSRNAVSQEFDLEQSATYLEQSLTSEQSVTWDGAE